MIYVLKRDGSILLTYHLISWMWCWSSKIYRNSYQKANTPTYYLIIIAKWKKGINNQDKFCPDIWKGYSYCTWMQFWKHATVHKCILYSQKFVFVHVRSFLIVKGLFAPSTYSHLANKTLLSMSPSFCLIWCLLGECKHMKRG